MALKQNQPKRGTQRESSSNSTARSGRDSFLKPNASGRGTKRGTSTNSSDRSTRPVPKETQSARGTHGVRGGDGAGSVKSIPDGVGSPFPSA